VTCSTCRRSPRGGESDVPFASKKQERYLFSQHPDVARKFVADAKAAHEPMIRGADIDLYRRQLAEAYRSMQKPAAQTFHDAPGSLDLAAKAYQANPTP